MGWDGGYCIASSCDVMPYRANLSRLYSYIAHDLDVPFKPCGRGRRIWIWNALVLSR